MEQQPQQIPQFKAALKRDPIVWKVQQGISLRDYFAAAALASFNADHDLLLDIADMAYELADRMMERRRKGTDDTGD